MNSLKSSRQKKRIAPHTESSKALIYSVFLGIGASVRAVVRLLKKLIVPILKIAAILVIAVFFISWIAFIFAGYFVSPIIPFFSPEPLVSGYIGFYSGIIAFGVIPLVILIWLFFKLLWGYKVGTKTRRATLATWMVCVVLFGSTILFAAKNFSQEDSSSEMVYQEMIDIETPVVIDLQSSYNLISDRDRIHLDFEDVFISRGDVYLRSVDFRLRPSEDETMRIEKSTHAFGKNRQSARTNLSMVNHDLNISDKRIEITDFVKLRHGDRFRFQSYNYEIKVPIGSKIIFKGDADMIPLKALKDRTKISTSTIYTMTPEGLVPSEIIGENL